MIGYNLSNVIHEMRKNERYHRALDVVNRDSMDFSLRGPFEKITAFLPNDHSQVLTHFLPTAHLGRRVGKKQQILS